MMAYLNLTLLGPFQVTNNGLTVTQFEADTARALLAYLAMQPAIAFPREFLADLLWADQSREDALVALRQTLTRLRRAIDDAYAAPPFLTITRQSIAFNPASNHWLDVATFTQLVGAVRTHRHRRLESCPHCMQQLEQAANLYRGDFLTGFALNSLPFEEWALIERERLHQQAMDTFYHLAAYHNQCGNYKQAQHYARRQLSLEPWGEEAHRQLLCALALSGQRSAALAQYKTMREVLMAELGVEPAAASVQLMEQIREGQLEQPPALHNLPVFLTSFVGRKSELAYIAERLADPDCRLLTVLGPGGVGKTRLALMAAAQMAAHFQHGVGFISLLNMTAPPPPLTKPAQHILHNQIAIAIATALNYSFSGPEQPKKQLFQALAAKEMLLILDNFEHLSAAADFVIDLLKAAPSLTILATSRAKLNLQAEQVLKLKGLPVPPEGAPDAADYSSVQLFSERSQRARADFCLDKRALLHVARLCRMLHGLPLGIELTATWVARLSLRTIVRNLQRDIDFLSVTQHDIPRRHRCLRAVFESSWECLSPTEQRALVQLSVFRGDFSYAAAQAIAQLDLTALVGLVDKSLLHTGNPDRYIVHNLLRQFAAEKLLTGEVVDESGTSPENWRHKLQERHARYYLAFIAEKTLPLHGAAPQRAIAAVQLEMANVRQAWQWAGAHLGRPPYANGDGRIEPVVLADCIAGLLRYYDLKGLFQEGVEMFGAAAVQVQVLLPHAAPFPTVQPVILHVLTRLRMAQAHFMEMQGDYQEALALLQPDLTSIQAGVSSSGSESTTDHMDVLRLAGDCYHKLGDYPLAEQCYTQSLHLAATLENLEGQAGAHLGLGNLAWKRGDVEQAHVHHTQSLDIWRKIGDVRNIAQALHNLGNCLHHQDHYTKAQHYYEESLALHREIGDISGTGSNLNGLGSLAYRAADLQTALNYFAENLALRRKIGEERAIASCLHNLGIVAYWQRDYPAAQAYQQESLDIKRRAGNRWGMAFSLRALGYVTAYSDPQKAWEYCEQSLAIRREIGDQRGVAESLNGLGFVAHQRGDYATAQKYYEAGLELAREIAHQSVVNESLLGLAFSHLKQNQPHISQRYCHEMLALTLDVDFLPDTLMNVFIFARLYWQQQAYPKSAELLGFVYKHPLIRPDSVTEMAALKSDLESVLTEEAFQRAWEQGQSLDLNTVLEELKRFDRSHRCSST